MFDLSLFISHLNKTIENTPMADALGAVCDLLSIHTQATATLLSPAGTVLIEYWPQGAGQYSPDFGEEIEKAGKKIAPQMALIKKTFLNGYQLRLSRASGDFLAAEMLAVKLVLPIFTLVLKEGQKKLAQEKSKRQQGVRNLINALTYSELEAIGQVMRDLDKKEADKTRTGRPDKLLEGIVVARHIAAKLNITHSVITSALKKLEGASLIDTRSLGMKGTYIAIKEPLLVEELKKL